MTWKNILEPYRSQKTIWRMRIARLIPEATNTHSEYVILIVYYGNSGYANRSQYSVVRTLTVLFIACGGSKLKVKDFKSAKPNLMIE
jgi:hypothetical protein